MQRRTSPDSASYIGRGKLAEIVAQRDSTGYTLVVFDDELSPSQQRNLERALEVKVLDRTALILDIFALRARTREGQLQVELAQSAYLLPLLAAPCSPPDRLGVGGSPGSDGSRGPGQDVSEANAYPHAYVRVPDEGMV